MNSQDDIAASVRQAMHQYFLDLDGEAPQPIYEMVLAQVEKPLIEVVLAHAQGNQTRAAELLGTTRRILKYRMDKLNIASPDEPVA